MALTSQLSPKELQRVANLSYEGKTFKVMLCTVGASGYDASSTVTNWQSREISGNGYSRFSVVIGTGSYNATSTKYELPSISAAFTASGGALTFDRVVSYIDGATYVHKVCTENPNIVLADGVTQTYTFKLNTDD